MINHPWRARLVRILRNRYFGLGVVGVAVVVLLAITWVARSDKDGLMAYDTETGGFKYQFMFYKGSTPVKLSDGSEAVKEGTTAALGVKPANAPLIKQCSEIGKGWTEAVRVNMLGTDTPVCAHENGYIAVVQAAGGTHLMTLSFKTQQKDDIKSLLRTVFSSLKVSR